MPKPTGDKQQMQRVKDGGLRNREKSIGKMGEGGGEEGGGTTNFISLSAEGVKKEKKNHNEIKSQKQEGFQL